MAIGSGLKDSEQALWDYIANKQRTLAANTPPATPARRLGDAAARMKGILQVIEHLQSVEALEMFKINPHAQDFLCTVIDAALEKAGVKP